MQFPIRIFFDGACPVCSREVEHYLRKDHAGRLIPIDISAPGFDPGPYCIRLEDFMHELHVIDQHGEVYRGVAAFCAIWRAFPASIGYRLLGTLLNLPGINALARLGYRGFARLRPRLPGRRDVCVEGSCGIGRDKRSGSKGEGQ